MKTIDLEQGTPEWHAHRLTHFNASDAPAMMGCSPYETRNALIKRLATGIRPEVDAGTQARFKDGHRTEALARVLAEARLGEELYPQVGVLGKFSASFDGLTLDDGINWEHKMLNDAIRAAFAQMDTIAPQYREVAGAAELPLMYRVQMEHQMLVSAAGKSMFHATKWQGENLQEELFCWYFGDADLRGQIIAGWEQLEADVAAYVPDEVIDAPVVVGRGPDQLPALRSNVTGSLVLDSNIKEWEAAALEYIKGVREHELKTDEDFANADEAAKWCVTSKTALQGARAQLMGSTGDVNAAVGTLDRIMAELDKTRTAFTNAIKDRKDARKVEIVAGARAAFTAYCAELDGSIGKPYMPTIGVDFGAAVKGLKTFKSMQNAVDTLLAKSKIAANDLCADIRKNLATLRADAKGYETLFADVATLVLKAPDDLAAVIATRIAAQKAKDAAKAEADRLAEEARTAAALEAQAAAIRAEERIKAEAKAEAAIQAAQAAQPAPEQKTAAVTVRQTVMPLFRSGNVATPAVKTGPTRPTDMQIVELLALHYRVHESKVVEWLTAMDMQALSDSLETEFA